jgi:eukaryotic-like serine/threonine-protein kinase
MSDSESWTRIKDIFRQCQTMPETDREAWLSRHCNGDDGLRKEIEELLVAQRASPGILADGAIGVLAELRGQDSVNDLVGHRIGPYRLLRLIGEGGMGSVFLAERHDGDFVQRVALKLVRAEFANAQTRARFLRERNFLARLVHPHIAQLHDGGVAADGTPYFTLEFVEGEPLTRYCDAKSLTITQRVKLILQVCAAVSYAHRSLIVHRDLKPSNILVTPEGDVKLLDFGIAKLLDVEADAGQTATQARMMTPEYAAPEQVLGEPITTATDVYAIGVLLYELLCGRLPYARADAGVTSWAKAVVEEAPENLGRALSRETGNTKRLTGDAAAATRNTTLPQLRRSLRGDLDRIVQRALAKEPEARYPSVSALADDLNAFVAGRALSGGTRTYRLAKFLRRHWMPLTAAAALMTCAIAGAWIVIADARKIERQGRTTEAVKDFLLNLFNASSPSEAKGKDLSVRELLDRGNFSIDHGLTAEPELRAELQGVLGRIYFQLGLYDRALGLQQSALAAEGAAHKPAAKRQLAETLAAHGDTDHAAPLAEEASAELEADGDVGERIRTWVTRSSIAERQGKNALAEQYAERAVLLARQPHVPNELLGNALSAQGLVEWDLRDLAKSEKLYREALQIHRAAFGDLDLRVAADRKNLTLALRNLGRYDEALTEAKTSAEIYERILGAQHPDVGAALMTLGTTQYHMAHYAEAELALRRGVAIERSSLGDNPATATAMNNLGLMLMDWHGIDEAEQILSEAMRMDVALIGPNHASTLIIASNLGELHSRQGKFDLAERELRDVIARDHAAAIKDQIWELFRLGEVRRRRGDWQEAITLNRAALQQAMTFFSPTARHAALAHYYLGLALADGGQNDESEKELRASLAAFRVLLPPDGAHPFAASARLALGKLIVARADGREEGLRLLSEATELRERFLGIDDERTREAREALQRARNEFP